MIIDVIKYLFVGSKTQLDAFFARAQEKGCIEFITPPTKKLVKRSQEVKDFIAALKILRTQPLKENYLGTENRNVKRKGSNINKKKIPIILVASKSDLLDKTPKAQIVSNEIVEDFIQRKNLQGYFKTSALENRNVLEVFKALTNLMLKSRNYPAIVI